MESLPDDRAYQILDFIEFLESKYAERAAPTGILAKITDTVEVSTVWLGLNHSFIREYPLTIFETLIFGGLYDGDIQRYGTEEQALAGHLHAVNEMRQGRSPW